jgi:predicted metalloprotease with PDZ domain
MRPPPRWFLPILTVTWMIASGASAQVGAGLFPLGPRPTLPTVRDHAFASAINLMVDATDTVRGIFSVTEAVPVQAPGDMVLLYPEWETGSHAPTATPVGLAGLVATVDGRRVEWRRDAVDMHAFHVPVPPGAHAVGLSFQFIPPASAGWLRPEMIDVQLQRLLLYPAGWFARDVPVAASFHLPDGMRAFTSLDGMTATGALLHFATVPLDRLADAPVYASRAWRELTLAAGKPSPVHLDLLADDPADLAIDDAETARMNRLLAQALHVFGPPPFPHYDMLVSLSDVLSPGGGIEHLEEGENNLPAGYLRDLGKQLNNRDLVAHELVHAWNGRFRQPEDLWTPNFNQPAKASLLWVYEGQTEFWGRMLAARSGLRSTQQTLDKLALDAAVVANRPGRNWKSLADSTNDAIYMAGRPVGWRDWQRREITTWKACCSGSTSRRGCGS